MKTCRTCQRALPLDSFTVVNRTTGYLQLDCKPCAAAKKREHRRGNPDYLAYQREYYRRNHATELERQRAANARAYRRLKLEIVERLGGVCAACGHEDVRVLQIDHVNGGGGAERKNVGHAKSLRLIRDALRADEACPEYQLLCANCHALKTLGYEDAA